jgi:cytochrome c biogenesis protein CcmG, thiol:disulfide interchange protein DsbE
MFAELLIGLAYAGAPEMIPMEALEIVGHPAPQFELPLRDGGTFDLSAQKGRIVVISFWASWCGPCRAELPAMTELAKTRSDITFIAVNVDRQRADADKFLKAVNVGLPIALDNDSLALGNYMVMSMPTSFVVAPDGTVAFKKIGYSQEKGFTELLAAIDGIKR